MSYRTTRKHSSCCYKSSLKRLAWTLTRFYNLKGNAPFLSHPVCITMRIAPCCTRMPSTLERTYAPLFISLPCPSIARLVLARRIFRFRGKRNSADPDQGKMLLALKCTALIAFPFAISAIPPYPRGGRRKKGEEEN